jgi:hypothetical protein
VIAAKTYLQQIRTLDNAIKAKQSEIYKLECLATNTTVPTDREAVQTSGISDKVGSLCAKIADLQKEIEQEKTIFIEQQQERIKVLELLRAEDALLYFILHRRYVSCCALKEISKEICYSYDYTRELHGLALKKIQKIMENINLPTQTHIL